MRYNLGRDFWQNEPKLEGPRFAAKMAADVRQHIKAMVGVSCDVVLKAPGEVPRSQGKAVRVKDLRQANKP
jgi:phenylacetate-coenzyme A ligase PaaK-like adenylate-forming protein